MRTFKLKPIGDPGAKEQYDLVVSFLEKISEGKRLADALQMIEIERAKQKSAAKATDAEKLRIEQAKKTEELKKQQEEAARKKQKEEDEKKKQADAAEAARKKQEEEDEKKKQADAAEAARKKQEEEDEKKKQADAAEAARKKQEEEDEKKKQADAAEAARKKQEEEDEKKKQADAAEAARKKQEEEDEKKKQADAAEAARKKQEEEDEKKKQADAAEAARKQAEEEEATRKKKEEAVEAAAIAPVDVTEYLKGANKSTRTALDAAKGLDGNVPKNVLTKILEGAVRAPSIDQFVPKDVDNVQWKAYLAGYGDMGGIKEELLDDETPLGQKRLQAAVFANITKKSKVAATEELRRKALAFSQ